MTVITRSFVAAERSRSTSRHASALLCYALTSRSLSAFLIAALRSSLSTYHLRITPLTVPSRSPWCCIILNRHFTGFRHHHCLSHAALSYRVLTRHCRHRILYRAPRMPPTHFAYITLARADLAMPVLWFRRARYSRWRVRRAWFSSAARHVCAQHAARCCHHRHIIVVTVRTTTAFTGDDYAHMRSPQPHLLPPTYTHTCHAPACLPPTYLATAAFTTCHCCQPNACHTRAPSATHCARFTARTLPRHGPPHAHACALHTYYLRHTAILPHCRTYPPHLPTPYLPLPHRHCFFSTTSISTRCLPQ